MRSLVTGGTGFLGANVVRALLKAEGEVRVLVRKGSNLANIDGLPVEPVVGDVRDPESLRRAVEGCNRVYHVAALYSFWVKDPALPFEVNVGGTRNVLEAARRAGVERVVYTSSVAALAIPERDRPASEDTPVEPERIVGAYKRSKYLAEEVAREYVKQGLPVVIVNPSFPVGPYDIRPTPTGQLILDFLNRRLPAYMDTGMNVVDAEIVGQGHLLAAERGRIGERYILGGENVSMRDLLEILSDITGLPAPRFRLPYLPGLGMAYLNAGICRLTGGTPRMTPETIRLTRHYMYYDPKRAFEELGLPRTSIRDALKKAVDWFVANGYVESKLPSLSPDSR